MLKDYQLINDYDIKVLLAINKINNNKGIHTEDMTSWLVMKELTPKGRERENEKILNSLKNMKKLDLVKLNIREYPKIIRKFWKINDKKVFFGKKDIKCIIRDKEFKREF